ncbi:hypothetical protein [Cohnella sp. WQ 127256]|uniref:hypothetical protein n=1 Tax=Cohnella sp. WQ 127256 TaxID=2938790 RepID=UPI002117A466|nr:hypothetical protein [Cohnella sp. WQ 127256]
MNRRRKLLTLILSISVIMGTMQATIYAQDTVSKSAPIKILEPVSLGNVTLKEGVTASVNNLIVLPSSSNQIVSLTLSIKNNSNSELNFLDYWVNLYTKSGTKLNIQLADTKVSKIPAKSTVNIDFIGTLGSTIKATDLIVKVIKWDFSVASYTKVLGALSVPVKYSTVTPSNSGRMVVAGDTKASFIVKQATIGKSESYYRPEIKLMIRNDGNRTITLPDYQLFVLTKENLMYPLSVKDIKGATLDPLTEKEFQLTTSIPIKVEENGWKLAVVNSINEGKDKQPLAVFELPKAQVDSGEVTGKYYTFSTSKGIYNIKLNSMNRLPIEDDDLVISNLTIANKGTTSLPMPALSGKYVFNESIEKTATSTNNNKVISLQPGASANIQLVSRVPYTFDISKLNLVVQQKESSGTNEEMLNLVEFTTKGKFDAVQKIKSDVGFKIEDVGYRSEVKVRNQMIYTGVSANVLVAQLSVENQEKRQAVLKTLAGYFQKADGTVFPATFENVTEKLSPGGAGIVYVSATIPKDTDVSGMNLVVGKAVTETTSNPSEAGATTENLIGYTDPYSFLLPAIKQPQVGLQKIDLKPFELSIKRVGTQIRFDKSEITLEFDYSLSQDLLNKASMKDHKIVIEIKDENRKVAFSRELSLPTTSTPTAGSENTNLLIGDHTLTLSPWNDDQLVFLIDMLRDFDLNIYHQIQPGYKTLIASEKISWLVDRKLK